MRIDKFLKVSRILKRRTLAQEACDGGRVKVNNKSVKPSFALKVGDVVEFGGLLGTGPVMAVNDASSDAFVARGGRIPAPIHSLRN